MPPLRHRRMERRGDACLAVAELSENVVLDAWNLPEQTRDHGLDFVEVFGEMQKEVEHVDALIEHDAAAGALDVGAPALQVVDLDGFAIPAPHPEQTAE